MPCQFFLTQFPDYRNSLEWIYISIISSFQDRRTSRKNSQDAASLSRCCSEVVPSNDGDSCWLQLSLSTLVSIFWILRGLRILRSWFWTVEYLEYLEFGMFQVWMVLNWIRVVVYHSSRTKADRTSRTARTGLTQVPSGDWASELG